MTLTVVEKCWICGDPADSGEHKIKARELRILFGNAPKQVLYFHSEKCSNLKIQSIKADRLKFSRVICQKCNSTRTQRHDKAWDKFSDAVRGRNVSAGDVIRFNRIFRYGTKHYMRWVHLYFVKVLGCAIAEHKIPIDLKKFSDSIMQDKLHPNVYLAFGSKPSDFDIEMASISNLDLYSDKEGVAFALFFVFLPHLTVAVMYAREGEEREGLDRSWHPKRSCQCTEIFDADMS